MSARPRALALALASATLAACELDPREPLDLDAIEEPTGACVTVVHDSLELGVELHSYVGDAPGSAGGWGLATILDADEQPKLALVRVPASADEAPTMAVELGLAGLAGNRFELRPGLAPGELWVLQQAPLSTSIRKLAPELGVVAGNGSLANFPPDDGVGCPTYHQRQLLLIEGRPFVLAVPDCSDSPALELQLLELDAEALTFANSWSLEFDPCALDPINCALAYPYTLAHIGFGESTAFAAAERVAVGFTQIRDFGGGVTSTDVSLLDLRLTAGGPQARLVTFREVWLSTTYVESVDIAHDPFSVQLHARRNGSLTDAALLRFDTISDYYVQLDTPSYLPYGGPGQLIQLANQSAMLDDRDGGLAAVPLIDVDGWPQWEPRTILDFDEFVSFEPAGVGQLLLRREDGPPRLVDLRCLESNEG